MREAIRELGLGNAVAVQARVEAWRPGTPFDTVICRALDTLAGFVRASGHLAAPAGRLVAMKGRHPATELGGLPNGWRAVEVARVEVPGLAAERHVVVIERDGDG
jgi:16S rRNA (guanine527-N7)-methyltransferase